MNNAESLEQKYRELQDQYALLLEQKKHESKQYHTQIKQHQSQVQQQQSQIDCQQRQLKKQQQLIQQQQSEIETYESEIVYLQERLNILLSKRYQAQSEQLKAIQGQLFDEAELEREIAETRQAIEELRGELDQQPGVPAKPTPKQKPKRQPLPSHLHRVEVVVDVSDEDKQAMGDEWTCIGHETSEQLAVQQREYYVKVIQRKKYVRHRSANHDDEQAPGIRVAPAAKVILPRRTTGSTDSALPLR
ncbi:MAG: transposase [Candidatus Thiodiazotropha sp.]